MWIEKMRMRMIPSQKGGIENAIRNHTRAT
jgi:hypothetical protein